MRRVEVHRWPAVPTAPKKVEGTARDRSASGKTMTAALNGVRAKQVMRKYKRRTIVATKLKQRFAEPGLNGFANLTANTLTTGEAY